LAATGLRIVLLVILFRVVESIGKFNLGGYLAFTFFVEDLLISFHNFIYDSFLIFVVVVNRRSIPGDRNFKYPVVCSVCFVRVLWCKRLTVFHGRSLGP